MSQGHSPRRAMPEAERSTTARTSSEITAGATLYHTQQAQAPSRVRRVIARAGLVAVCLVVLITVIGYSPWRDSYEDSASRDTLATFIAALNADDTRTAMTQVHLDTGVSPFVVGSTHPAHIAYSVTTDFTKVSDAPGRQVYAVDMVLDGTEHHLEWAVVEAQQKFLIDYSSVLSIIRTPGKLPVTINGHTIPGETGSISALPGVYDVGTGTPWLDYVGNSTLVLPTRTDVAIDTTPVVPTFTTREVANRVASWLDDCLTTTQISTGCGWTMSFGNGTVVPGSVSWSLVGRDPTELIDLSTATWSFHDNSWWADFECRYTTGVSGQGVLDDGQAASFTDIEAAWVTTVTARMDEAPALTFATVGA